MIKHKVKSGDCLASICKEYGFHDPAIIFDDQANADLKSTRKNMHVLMKKDTVVIPEKTNKTAELSPETSAKFTVKGIITQFSMLIQSFDGQALADKHYLLEVEGKKYEGKTDGNGLIEHKVDAAAINAELTVYLDDNKKNNIFWPLEIGSLAPAVEKAGLQARLNNLGYYCKNETGNMDKSTKAAVLAFKQSNGLPADDVVDSACQNKVLSVYGL